MNKCFIITLNRYDFFNDIFLLSQIVFKSILYNCTYSVHVVLIRHIRHNIIKMYTTFERNASSLDIFVEIIEITRIVHDYYVDTRHDYIVTKTTLQTINAFETCLLALLTL